MLAVDHRGRSRSRAGAQPGRTARQTRRRRAAAQGRPAARRVLELVAGWPSRCSVDQHPAGRRHALQPGGGVHHVAGDDRLAAVAGRGEVHQRLAGGDADPEARGRSPAAAAGPAPAAPPARPGPRAARRSRWRRGRRRWPSPRRRCTSPPPRRTGATTWRTVAKYACCRLRACSGSARSANVVKPAMSMKSTLTWRRSSARSTAAVGAAAAPQAVQNAASGAVTVPAVDTVAATAPARSRRRTCRPARRPESSVYT